MRAVTHLVTIYMETALKNDTEGQEDGELNAVSFYSA